MRVKSFKEALHFARRAVDDAANRRMRKAGRKSWSEADYAHAVHVTEDFLVNLGFDIPGWTATAGFPRNEPDEPKPARRSKRRSKAAPVQLSFAFA